MRTLATAILGAAMILGAQAPMTPACAAAAVRAPSLTAVSFTPRKDSLEFVFRAQAPITADQVSVYGDADDAEVLNLKIEGAAVTRRWVTMPDAQIDRALLHPSTGSADAAVLRIRMQSKNAVVAAILDAVKVHEAEGAVVVKVPRTAVVAAEWAQAEKPAVEAAPAVAVAPAAVAPAPAPVSAAAPAPASALVVAAPVSAAVVLAPASAAAEADKLPSLADAPLTLLDDGTTNAEDPGAVVANAGVSESTGMGAAAATICLMLAGGFFLWRKIKGQGGERGTGRLIRPLGTHVLGPKQGLLLLDVAGEMVLIGTSDKGVQMLTKIEKSDRVEAPAMARAAFAPAASAAPAPAASSNTNHADLELLKNESAARAPKMNVAERASAAIAKVRALSEARAAKAKGMETADEDVTADALERSFFDRADEHLAQAADGVEDDFEPRAENFFARLKKAAERPAEAEAAPAVKTPTPRVGNPTPAPVAARKATPAAPRNAGGDDAALTNDILRKIRQLQGA